MSAEPRPAPFWATLRGLLPTARAAMEFCWLSPWIVVLGGGLYGRPAPLIDAAWAFALLVGGQVATRRVLDRDWPLRRARVALVAGGLVLGLLAVHARHYPQIPTWHPVWIAALLSAAHDVLPLVPAPVTAALAAACLWWRGLVLGSREADAFTIEGAYKTGVAMIVAYLLAAAVYADTAGFRAAGPGLPATLPAFFFLGLSTLALARLAAVWERAQPDERAQGGARAWALLVVGAVGGIVLLASLSAGLAAADVATYLGLALRPMLPVVELVFVILFFFASIVVRVLIAVLERLPRLGDREMPVRETAVDDLLRRLREIRLDPQVVEGARWSMVVVVLVLLLLGMALTIVWMRRRPRPADEDEHESVWSGRAALAGLLRAARRLRLRGRVPGEAARPSARAIRRIYREVLALGTRAGVPRPAWATPREHLPRLAAALAPASDEVTVLTEAYERVRYGGWTPQVEQVREAEEALGRIRAAVPVRPSSAARSR